jgi:hypothetical protein
MARRNRSPGIVTRDSFTPPQDIKEVGSINEALAPLTGRVYTFDDVVCEGYSRVTGTFAINAAGNTTSLGATIRFLYSFDETNYAMTDYYTHFVAGAGGPVGKPATMPFSVKNAGPRLRITIDVGATLDVAPTIRFFSFLEPI